MPSQLHEMLVELFRDQPELAAELLAGPLGIPVPSFDGASLSSGELTEVVPTEYRADAVVTMTVRGAPVLAVVVEVQLRPDSRKRRSWPVYVATVYARLGCPVMLLVVAPGRSVAAWCAKPVVVSDPGLVLTPVVLGPERVPVVTDAGLARRSPPLAVLSALAHGGQPGQRRVLEVLLAAFEVVDHDRAELYADVVLGLLPAAARGYLEELMKLDTYEFQSDFARRYVARGELRGEARGEARAVLAFLDARGVEVPEDVREHIANCTDLGQLDRWVRRAATADKVEELFDWFDGAPSVETAGPGAA